MLLHQAFSHALFSLYPLVQFAMQSAEGPLTEHGIVSLKRHFTESRNGSVVLRLEFGVSYQLDPRATKEEIERAAQAKWKSLIHVLCSSRQYLECVC